MSGKRAWWLSGKSLVAAAALGVLLRAAVVTGIDVFPTVANTWDSHFYHETATALAQGDGYSFQGKPTALFPPGFPAALSLMYGAAGSATRQGQWLNVILSLVLAGAAAAWVRAVWGGDAARMTH